MIFLICNSQQFTKLLQTLDMLEKQHKITLTDYKSSENWNTPQYLKKSQELFQKGSNESMLFLQCESRIFAF